MTFHEWIETLTPLEYGLFCVVAFMLFTLVGGAAAVAW